MSQIQPNNLQHNQLNDGWFISHGSDIMLIERLFVAIMMVVCIGLLYLAWGFTATIAYDPIGPRPYPMLIFGLLVVSCLFLVVRPMNPKHVVNLGLSKPILINLALCVVALLMYAGLFELLGFPIATALASFAIGVLFAGQWLKSLIFSLVLGVVLYVFFDRLLDVTLPLGMLSKLGV